MERKTTEIPQWLQDEFDKFPEQIAKYGEVDGTELWVKNAAKRLSDAIDEDILTHVKHLGTGEPCKCLMCQK